MKSKRNCFARIAAGLSWTISIAVGCVWCGLAHEHMDGEMPGVGYVVGGMMGLLIGGSIVGPLVLMAFGGIGAYANNYPYH